jgi:hypothetical protein
MDYEYIDGNLCIINIYTCERIYLTQYNLQVLCPLCRKNLLCNIIKFNTNDVIGLFTAWITNKCLLFDHSFIVKYKIINIFHDFIDIICSSNLLIPIHYANNRSIGIITSVHIIISEYVISQSSLFRIKKLKNQITWFVKMKCELYNILIKLLPISASKIILDWLEF